MKNIPSARIQKNIENFCSMWAAGNMVACKESYTAASDYINRFGDWMYENVEKQYDQIVGVIEYINFHERANFSVKKWKL